jgi:DNA-binding FadR family transcriptional regulator
LSSAITGAATLLVGMGAFDIDEIIDARLETETICCRLACERRSGDDLAAMRTEVALQRSASPTDEEFCASDVRFHRALVTAAGNGPLSLMMYTVVEAFMPITNMIVSQVRERPRVASFHERLADAIDAREAAAATQILSELLFHVRDSYATSLRRRAEREAARLHG